MEKEKKPENLLRSLRKDKEISQTELARKLNVDASYISKMENGKEKPSRKLTAKLAEALDAGRIEILLAFSYLPAEFTDILKERKELRRLLKVASENRLSEDGYQALRKLLEREDKINVPVWLGE